MPTPPLHPPIPSIASRSAGCASTASAGVYPSERERLQPLGLDLTLHLDTRKAASGGHLADTVDYARVAGDLRFILEHARFLLLEVAAEALCRYLLAPLATGAQIDEVSLTLRKTTGPRRAGRRLAERPSQRRGVHVHPRSSALRRASSGSSKTPT
ncbi:MAG: dihydroneopterin aldolase [Nannocystis sp.]|nr:dihydroneopterin aldolase [Nannocystis sp.]